MENFPLNSWMFWILILPGFLTVWVFRYFNRTKGAGEFEYAGLSIFWGLFILFLTSMMWKIGLLKGIPDTNLTNPGQLLGLASLLCIVTFVLGWAGSSLANFKWFKTLINAIRPENFWKLRK